MAIPEADPPPTPQTLTVRIGRAALAVLVGGSLIGLIYFPFLGAGWRGAAVAVLAGVSIAAVFVVVVEWKGPLSGRKAAIACLAAGATAGCVVWLVFQPPAPLWITVIAGALLLLAVFFMEELGRM